MQISVEIRNRLVKQSGGRPFFPETTKALTEWWSGPDPKSPEGAAGAKQDAKIKNQAIMTALRMAGVGLMAGGGVRLLQEGYNRFLRKPDFPDTGDEITVDIHRPQRKRFRRGSRIKQSAMESVKDWALSGPLAVAGTGLGLYGGYQGVRSIADWLKKRELDVETEAAKQEFEDALDEQFAASRVKSSALGAAIGSAYEEWTGSEHEKQAFLGEVKGGLIGTAALIWLLSHSAAFSRLRKSDPEAFRKKVLIRQRRLRQAASPPPILFEFPEEDKEDDEPKRIPMADYPEEKAAAAVDHACGACEYLSDGDCKKRDKVKQAVGEDNLTIYLASPTKTNSCPEFDAELAEPTKQDPDDMIAEDAGNEPDPANPASLVLSNTVKQAIFEGIKQFGKDLYDKGTKLVTDTAANSPWVQQQIVQAAGQSANDPKTLQPAAKEIASNPNVQAGMNQAAMQKVQGIPILGSLFG